MAIQKTFQRYEKKYLMTEAQYEAFCLAIEPYMRQDQYGLHTICNIYYDTADYELIRKSLEKPMYKEKFRIRSYGVPKAMDTVFLEIKKKYDGIVYKRRVPMPYEAAMENLKRAHEHTEVATGDPMQQQIFNEIAYFFRQKELQPRVFIAYDRVAYIGREEKELRLTVDCNIRYRELDLELAKGDFGESIIPAGEYLMEIKTPGAMPLWLAHVLAKERIYPVSFSKYGTYYKQKKSGGNENVE